MASRLPGARRGPSGLVGHAVTPMSIGTTAPEMYEASSEARDAISVATSSGCAISPVGGNIFRYSRGSLPSTKAKSLVIGVSIPAGATALTRTPRRLNSTAIARVINDTPPFDAQYAALYGCPKRPALDETLTMQPRLASRCGRQARETA